MAGSIEGGIMGDTWCSRGISVFVDVDGKKLML